MPLTQCNGTLLTYNDGGNIKILFNRISDGQYCAQVSDLNGKDSCEGEGGGPLQFIPSGSELAKVVGIVAFGISCDTRYPSVYTRVAHYLDWIESHVWPNNQIVSQQLNTN